LAASLGGWIVTVQWLGTLFGLMSKLKNCDEMGETDCAFDVGWATGKAFVSSKTTLRGRYL